MSEKLVEQVNQLNGFGGFQVNWRPVIGGFILQFYFAALILKWDMGYNMFRFMGEEARKFLAFTDIGSRFVFGDKFTDHIFVMQVCWQILHSLQILCITCMNDFCVWKVYIILGCCVLFFLHSFYTILHFCTPLHPLFFLNMKVQL